MKKDCHAFNVSEAVKYGVEKAILLQHIRFWVHQNKGKDTHFHEGKVWMYQSVADIKKHYPYWSNQKIGRILRDMESLGIILSGNFNKIGYDQTKWYTLNIDCSELNNGDSKIEQPIPDTKPNTKTDKLFDECWALYGKKGNKARAVQYWAKLTEGDKENIKLAIPTYVKSRERKYRKDFQGWINPTYRMWEDEIVETIKEVISI